MSRMQFQLGYCLISLITSLPCSIGSSGIWGELEQMERGAHAARKVSDWVLHRRVEGNEVIRPIFMLRHSKKQLAEFEQTLWAVSTPGDLRYGHHLSRTDVAAKLPPAPGAQEAVVSWLSHHGIKEVIVGPTGDMIEVSITAKEAEKIFSTQLHHFKHSIGVNVIRAVAPYFVPKHIAKHLYIVGNLAYLPDVKSIPQVPMEVAKSEKRADDFNPWQSCTGCSAGSIQPAVLQKAYGFSPPWHPDSVLKKTSMAIATFQGISFDKLDLNIFQRSCHLNTSIKVDRVVGTNNPWKCLILADLCLEALLDIQVIKSVGGSIPLTVVSSVEYSYLKWIQEFDRLDKLPHVISISYGRDEIQEDSTDYMDAVNAQFMKLGARGASVLVSSGDQGVYGRMGAWDPSRKFHPTFPASSPYVTSVGGTDFLEKGIIGEEKAWSSSGGGFSDQFPAPPYQREAVDNFMNWSREAGTLPPQWMWNSSGRAYPDLSALGGQQNPYCVRGQILALGVAGTSASAPMVAGLIARLNALRVQEDLPPLGFLNPFIYQNLDAFNDVKEGNNSGQTGSKTHKDGFQAVPGWDPATGAGTPNFQKLSAAAMADVAPGSMPEQQAEQQEEQQADQLLPSNIFAALGCIAALLAFTFTRILRQRPKVPTTDYLIMEA